MTIFKAYDIRGIYGKDLTDDIAYRIGRALVTFLKAKKVVVGRDMRSSSEPLFKALAQGITDQGADVIDIGVCSTPVSYFGCVFLEADASVMITASHNPAEYNGFKLTREMAIPVSGDTGIKEIEALAAKEFEDAEKGSISSKNITDEYAKHVLSFGSGIKGLKIVIDAGNGMGGFEATEVLSRLPCTIVPLYLELDGSFPNHEANPLKPETLADLQKEVIASGADLGIAFDGDADRAFFIDDKGNIISSDFTLALIAREILKKEKGLVLYDIRSSWIAREVIEENQGTSKMCRVGHAFIKEQMRKEGAIFAGELAGHYYFKDNFFTDSAVIAAVIMLSIASKSRLSSLVEPLRKYYKSDEINFEVKDKEAKMDELSRHYKDGSISLLDGIRIDFDDWWFNVRPSNTEPLLRLNLEARTKELLEAKTKELSGLIKA